MPTSRTKAGRVEARAGETERRDAKGLPGGWLQPESYLIDVAQGGEVSKRTPDGWRVVAPGGGLSTGEPAAFGRPSGEPVAVERASGEVVAPGHASSEPAPLGCAPAGWQARPGGASTPGGNADRAAREPAPAGAAGVAPDVAPAHAAPGARLVNLSAEAPPAEAVFEAATLHTLRGIAALRTGATAGSVGSQESADELDAALESLRKSVTPVRVSRTRLVSARRRRRARLALAALAAALLAVGALALARSRGVFLNVPVRDVR